MKNQFLSKFSFQKLILTLLLLTGCLLKAQKSNKNNLITIENLQMSIYTAGQKFNIK
ncbi:hypothetical protein RB619_08580 [Flavobacterium sp. LHD-80]|uniref:hypothetical protein n=1 Tax=Flavobacterium sp. LHD-80 TaxID=3071411 RepID=UPI0027DFB610|nr:hypothetical protein [Flavobacterium sp. LHD-80]MDQ6470693.1 hypothetical protein [Flavobacterium sp. LHD-80]